MFKGWISLNEYKALIIDTCVCDTRFNSKLFLIYSFSITILRVVKINQTRVAYKQMYNIVLSPSELYNYKISFPNSNSATSFKMASLYWIIPIKFIWIIHGRYVTWPFAQTHHHHCELAVIYIISNAVCRPQSLSLSLKISQ